MDIRDYLIKAKQYLEEIESISRDFGIDPDMDTLTIENVIRRRDEIVAGLKGNQRSLDSYKPGWVQEVTLDPSLSALRNDAVSVLSRITEMDAHLAHCIENRMGKIQEQLSNLYHSSRAATCYTSHSTLSIAR